MCTIVQDIVVPSPAWDQYIYVPIGSLHAVAAAFEASAASKAASADATIELIKGFGHADPSAQIKDAEAPERTQQAAAGYGQDIFQQVPSSESAKRSESVRASRAQHAEDPSIQAAHLSVAELLSKSAAEQAKRQEMHNHHHHHHHPPDDSSGAARNHGGEPAAPHRRLQEEEVYTEDGRLVMDVVRHC